MFTIGEYIIYGSKGVCQVKDITTMDMEGVPADRLYYMLEPKNLPGSRVYTPVDNEKVIMRSLITKEEAEKLIREIPEVEEVTVTSEKLREQTYKEYMRSGQCRDYLRIIKTLYSRKKKRLASGKKSTSTDDRYMKLAEDALYSELSQQLEIPKEEMPAYIRCVLEA